MLPILAAVLLVSVVGADVIHVDCGGFRLGFDADTGQWVSLARAGVDEELLGCRGGPDVEAVIGAESWPKEGDWRADSPTMNGRRVSVIRNAPDWQVTTTYEVLADAPIIVRRAAIRYTGAEQVAMYESRLRAPGITLDRAPDSVWCLPGNYPVRENPFADNAPGRSTRERGWTWSDTGLSYARSEQRRIGLIGAYSLELDRTAIHAEELAGGVSLCHRFHTLAILRPGDEISIGAQMIRVVAGDWDAFKAATRDLAARANPGPPDDRPDWLTGAVLEELHPWGRLESWWAGDRGSRMPDIEAQLPYLRDLGVTGIWLLPISKHPPWVYNLPTFRHIDPKVTSPEQLESFIATGHELGMRTLMDLVTYGIDPASPDVDALPDHVWCLDEKGERQRAWSGTVLCADCTEPDWQAHMRALTCYWVREFGADGFRLDCGGASQAPNWRPRTSLHAIAGMLAGGVAQNAVIRKAIREINPEAVLLPEAGAPAHFRSSDLIFDYPLYMVCREMTREPSVERWVANARKFLATQQMTHSPRAVPALVRFTETHDCVAAQDFFGVGPSQALNALCAFLPGVFLLHQEQEIGFAPELREWLRLRRALPEITGGVADYEAVRASDPRVMAFLRATDDAACIVAINFGDADSECSLRVPDELASALPVAQDGLTCEPVDLRAPVAIPAWRPRVITLRAAAREVPQPPVERAPAAGALGFETTSEDLDEHTTRVTIRVEPVARWFVNTKEGLLVDEFVDRHRGTKEGETHVDATAPLARCWRPLELGLWDAFGHASFGAISADGRCIEIEIDDIAKLRRARIQDPSSTGDQVAFALDVAKDSRPFRVTNTHNAPEVLARLRRRPGSGASRPIDVDPLFVKVGNPHYELALSRRHGGTIWSLIRGGEDAALVAGPSEVYTDWGLFEKGKHIASEWETNPRLEVAPDGDGAAITFRGRLRIPSWNGVHEGPVAGPEVAYRLTYRVDESPVIGVTLGITPATDRPDAKAFFAFRLPFAGVDRWRVEGIGAAEEGEVGEQPGTRVYEAKTAADMSRITMRLSAQDREIVIRKIVGRPTAPDNPFLLDGGDGALHFFFALLEGEERTLAAGEERTASFELALD